MVPAAACAAARRSGLRGRLHVCRGTKGRRIGRWDYALIAPHYTVEQSVSLGMVRQPKSKTRAVLIQLDGADHANHDHPYVIVSSRSKRRQRWRSGQIAEFLDHLIRARGLDQRRVFLTGKKGSAGERFCLAEHRCRFIDQLD